MLRGDPTTDGRAGIRACHRIGVLHTRVDSARRHRLRFINLEFQFSATVSSIPERGCLR